MTDNATTKNADTNAKKDTRPEEDRPHKGHNPRADGKHKTKRYEVTRGGSRTLPAPKKGKG